MTKQSAKRIRSVLLIAFVFTIVFWFAVEPESRWCSGDCQGNVLNQAEVVDAVAAARTWVIVWIFAAAFAGSENHVYENTKSNATDPLGAFGSGVDLGFRRKLRTSNYISVAGVSAIQT